MLKFIASALALMLLASPAFAQGGVVCRDQQSGQIDVQASSAFGDMQRRTDRQLAQMMAGTWYSETPSPQTGQISRLYVRYGADGSLSYQNQVCSQTGCNNYQGQGAWAAISMGGGSFSGIQMISDAGRNQQCTGFTGRFLDRNTIQSAAGVSRRVG